MTLTDYVKAKALPLEFVKGLGLSEEKGNLKIPYFDQDGKVFRYRYRNETDTWWDGDTDKGTLPYGLNRLSPGLYCCLCEGESDTQTLWHYNFNALGVPGALNWKVEWSEYIKSYEEVLICFDNDDSGRRGTIDVARKLREGGYTGQIKAVPLPPDINDVNELHKRDPGQFTDNFVRHSKRAQPVEAAPEPENEPAPEVKKKKPQVSLSPRDIPCLVDVVQTEDGLKYLLKEAGELVLKDAVEVKGQTYIPPETVKLFSPVTERVLEFYESDIDTKLFLDLCGFIYEHVDHQEAIYYKVVAAWIMHTYLIESFDYSPYLFCYGPIGTGKSKQGEILVLLIFRGLFTVGITEAGIFRVTELFNPSFVIDELSIWRKDGKTDIQQLLNTRFQRGLSVVRINLNRDGIEAVETFNVFGATCIATAEEVPAALRSRRLLIVMDKNSRKIRRKVDVKRGRVLKDRLTAFRARHLGEALEIPDQLVNDGRLDDVVLPLHQIIRLCSPDSEEEFVNYVKGVEAERKEEANTSLDAKVVEAVAACSHLVEGGKFLVSDVTLEFNKELPEKERLSDRSIGRLLMRLGFKSCRNNQGKMARRWDEARLIKLQERYCLETSETSDTSETAPHSHAKTEVSEQTEVSSETEKPKSTPKEMKAQIEAVFGETEEIQGDVPF